MNRTYRIFTQDVGIPHCPRAGYQHKPHIPHIYRTLCTSCGQANAVRNRTYRTRCIATCGTCGARACLEHGIEEDVRTVDVLPYRWGRGDVSMNVSHYRQASVMAPTGIEAPYPGCHSGPAKQAPVAVSTAVTAISTANSKEVQLCSTRG